MQVVNSVPDSLECNNETVTLNAQQSTLSTQDIKNVHDKQAKKAIRMCNEGR